MPARQYTTPEGKYGWFFTPVYFLAILLYESFFHPRKNANISVKKNGNGSSQFLIHES